MRPLTSIVIAGLLAAANGVTAQCQEPNDFSAALRSLPPQQAAPPVLGPQRYIYWRGKYHPCPAYDPTCKSLSPRDLDSVMPPISLPSRRSPVAPP